MAYPDYYEEKGTRELTFNRRGAFGKKVWIAKWEYRFKAAPLLDTAFSLGYPRIRCTEVVFEPCGATGDGHVKNIDNGIGGTVSDTMDYSHCRITATYEYDILSGDEPEVSGDCSTEALNIAQGRFWSYCMKPTLMTPVPVEDATPVMIPGLSIVFRIVRWAVPLATIYAYTGKVNGASWNGAASETLLYEGATWNSDYNAQTGQFRWIIQHRFRWRAFSWNEIWRPPHLKTEADGTSIPDADGFPVYDIPAGWDRPIDGEGNSIYLPANFNDLML